MWQYKIIGRSDADTIPLGSEQEIRLLSDGRRNVIRTRDLWNLNFLLIQKADGRRVSQRVNEGMQMLAQK